MSDRPRLGGVTGKGFLPGQSGNPGGRPKGLVSLVRERTRDGEALVECALKLLRGEEVLPGRKPRLEDVRWAIEWLADRGFGRAVQTVDSTIRRATVFTTANDGPPQAADVVLPPPPELPP